MLSTVNYENTMHIWIFEYYLLLGNTKLWNSQVNERGWKQSLWIIKSQARKRNIIYLLSFMGINLEFSDMCVAF